MGFIPSWTREVILIVPKLHAPLVSKSPLWASILVKTQSCLYTSCRVYWFLSMGRIHQSPFLAHAVLCWLLLAPKIRFYCIVLVIGYTSVTVSPCYIHCYHIDLVHVKYFQYNIMCILYHCSVICYVLLCILLIFILSRMLNTFQVLMHTLCYILS